MFKFLFSVATVAVLFPWVSAVVAAPPNIILILTDDQGYADMGAFGTGEVLTPNMDRIASEGVRLNRFRASSSVCSPTRAALLTGQHPERAGVPGVIRSNPENSWGYLLPGITMLPQLLEPAGYRRALIGKWHLGLEPGQLPRDRGFDHFHGFLGDMMDDQMTHLRLGKNFMRQDEAVIEPRGHATDLFTDWACTYIREQSAAGQPFFLYLAYNAPHSPIQPLAPWLDRVRQRRPDLPDARQQLIAVVEHLDAGIGRVLETVDQTGITGNTLVILTSDNGGALAFGASNAPWRDGKGSMYDGGLRVPFAARWPGRIPIGSRSDIAAVTLDLFPTVLAAAGVEPDSEAEGVNLLPVLTGVLERLPPRDLFFIRREGEAFGGKEIEAVIRGRWKLLQNMPWSPRELYDLETDPGEFNDLANVQPKLVAGLTSALRAHRRVAGAVPWTAPWTTAASKPVISTGAGD